MMGLMSDLTSKHQVELQLQNLKISECRHHFQLNRCDQPVPEVRQFCMEQEKCLLLDANAVVKNFNIIIRLVTEVMNEFSHQITNRTLFVFGVVFLTLYAAYKLYGNNEVTLTPPLVRGSKSELQNRGPHTINVNIRPETNERRLPASGM